MTTTTQRKAAKLYDTAYRKERAAASSYNAAVTMRIEAYTILANTPRPQTRAAKLYALALKRERQAKITMIRRSAITQAAQAHWYAVENMT